MMLYIWFIFLCCYVVQYKFLQRTVSTIIIAFFSRCTPLPHEHPCRFLQNRSSNFTLPQLHPIDAVFSDASVQTGSELLETMRGEYPDECIDVLKHGLCFLVAPPCDPMSNGLPMLFCEQHCVVYTMLKEEGVCNSTIDIIHEFALHVESNDLVQAVSLLKNFSCNDVGTYQFFKSDNYAHTCTALISQDLRG